MSMHRRQFLAAASLLAAPVQLTLAQTVAGAKGDDPRFVFVLLRGGMDGLSAAPAVGDPDFASARGALAEFGAAPLVLPGTVFALHPHLAGLHAMYQRGDMAVVHAAGLAYRERSHFDAQQVLESGGNRPYELASGWLGRMLAAQATRTGLALTTAVPLVLRGSDRIDTWAPSVLPEPSADLVTRLEWLYAGDPALRIALMRAKGLREQPGMGDGGMGGNAPQGRQVALTLARRAGEMLAAERGPRVAVLEMGGWDTHANQSNPNGALANNLRTLDASLAELRDSLGATWSRTVVLVATEFGREVAINGTMGTDHGSGGVAFLLGGAVAGGRTLGDWPGLARAQRFEGRDLRVTTDLRAVMKGVLADHLRVPNAVIEAQVFPGSSGVKAISVLRS